MCLLGAGLRPKHRGCGRSPALDHFAQGQPGCGLQASHFLCFNKGSQKCFPTTASPPYTAWQDKVSFMTSCGSFPSVEPLGTSSGHSPLLPTGARTEHSSAWLLVKCHLWDL